MFQIFIINLFQLKSFDYAQFYSCYASNSVIILHLQFIYLTPFSYTTTIEYLDIHSKHNMMIVY